MLAGVKIAVSKTAYVTLMTRTNHTLIGYWKNPGVFGLWGFSFIGSLTAT